MLKNVNNLFASFKTTAKNNNNNNNDNSNNKKHKNLIEILPNNNNTNNNNNNPSTVIKATDARHDSGTGAIVTGAQYSIQGAETLCRSQSGTSVYQENCNLREICLTFEHFRSENYHNYLRLRSDLPIVNHSQTLSINYSNSDHHKDRLLPHRHHHDHHHHHHHHHHHLSSHLQNQRSENATSLRAITSGVWSDSGSGSVSCKVASLSNITDAVLYLRTTGTKLKHSSVTAAAAPPPPKTTTASTTTPKTPSAAATTTTTTTTTTPPSPSAGINVSRSITTTNISQRAHSPIFQQIIHTHPIARSSSPLSSSTVSSTNRQNTTTTSHYLVPDHFQTNLQSNHRSLSEYSFHNFDRRLDKLKSTSFEPIPEQTRVSSNNSDEKMLSPDVGNGSPPNVTSKLPSYIRLSKTISGYGGCKHYNLDEHLYERAKSSSSRHSDISDQFRSLPYDALLNQFQNSRNNDNSSPTAAPASSSSSSSFLQKKIASLYGNSFADDWQRSRSKSRQSNGNNERSPRSPSCPPARISESKEFTKHHKDFSPKELLKQMKEERLQQKQAGKDSKESNVEKLMAGKRSDLKIEKTNKTMVVEFQEFNESKEYSSSSSSSPSSTMIEDDGKPKPANIIPVLFESNQNNNSETVQQSSSSNKHSSVIISDSIQNIQSNNLQNTVPEKAEIESKCESTLEYEKFLHFIDKTRQEFSQQIQRYEKILEEFECSSDVQDGMGKVRATIGKANLLLTKKMNQFEQLCNDSLNQTGNEEFTIKNDDLQGFWDMLSIQIDEVRNGFLNLEKLQNNNWIVLPDELDSIYQPSPTSRNPLSSPAARKSKVSNKLSPTKTTSINSTSTGSDSERKAKLNEIKRKAKERMLANQAADKAEEEIYIFAPASGQELDSIVTLSEERLEDNDSTTVSDISTSER